MKKYKMLYLPDHPSANSKGCIREHVVVAEKMFGGLLPDSYEVHHLDENKSNNNPNNLMICPTRKYHMILHQRERAKKACGHADWLNCSFCQTYSPPSEMKGINSKNSTFYHQECKNAYDRLRRS